MVYPLESVTVETPDPVKLRPVTPTPTSVPLKYELIADPPLPVPPVIIMFANPSDPVIPETPDPVKLNPVTPVNISNPFR